jgi:glycosyltransferase involved in cell wall biosynthesis
MDNTYSQGLFDFLAETKPYMEQLDALSFDTAAELYDLLDDATRVATLHINEIDPGLRVEICDSLDKVLERIVDVLPPFENAGTPVGIYTPAIHLFRRWGNLELLKDKGLAGYMLAEAVRGHATMYFCTKPSDYPSLSVLQDMELLFTDDEPGMEKVYIDHLNTQFQKMDVLMLHGVYPQTVPYLNRYRRLRPDGIVYCGLDMNSYWMANIKWGSQSVHEFAGNCDVIATSCRFLRNALNNNPDVNFACRWLPNGFYNPIGTPVIANTERKENIILTVGRIGSAPKNNQELLTAFAEVADVLCEWSLYLVGPIESEFQTYIGEYFLKYPHLKERVVFTGAITDKTELYSEYARAKVFALTSLSEGFPNVYAEALFHGCKFVTSDIDAADDITNYGELGAVYKRGDVKGLADTLIKACSAADEWEMIVHIPKALAYAEKYFDWNRNAKKLAYMLFK